MVWADGGEKVDFINGNHSTLSDGGPGFLRDLAESVAHEGMLGIEVGCYTGWTASQVIPVFLKNNGRYHLLDWFRGSPDTQVGIWTWENFDSKRALIQCLKNMELQGWGDTVSVSVGTGDLICPLIENGILDYVYIGADHRYSQIKKDIQNWLPKIRSSGVLCGHACTGILEKDSEDWKLAAEKPEQDHYSKQSMHMGVVRALMELLPGYERIDNGLWSYRAK